MPENEETKSLSLVLGQVAASNLELSRDVDALRKGQESLRKEQAEIKGDLHGLSEWIKARFPADPAPGPWASDPWVRRMVVVSALLLGALTLATIGGIALGDGEIIKSGLELVKEGISTDVTQN